MTLPPSPDYAARERTRRLVQFRDELNTIGDDPSTASLQRLAARFVELGLGEDEAAEEAAVLRASLDALELKACLSRGEFPLVDRPELTAPGELCHFACPVRFGRRRGDHVGHLVLSNARLRFRGVVDVSASWLEVASVRRDGRELIVALHDRSRTLRFCCDSYGEAARAGVIAEHLTGRPEGRPLHVSSC